MSNGKQLAIQEARYQNCDLDIVLATVEAETDFTNKMGDSGNAYGYGQVWYAWWSANFDYAAKRLGVQYPTNMDDLAGFVTNNDEFSMIVAVKTIKDIWNQSNKNWHNFTLTYVGPQIPQWDYNRRKAIWDKYNNGSDASYSTNKPNGAYGTTSNSTSEASELAKKIFTPTDNKVIENSLTKGNILWGRKYRVLVTNPNGTALDVSQLRCTFRASKTVTMQANLSEVVIYNLNANTENTIITEGNEIIIEAGYEGEAQYGVIFRGQIIQPIRDKEDGHTYKLKLTSLDGDTFLNYGTMNVTYEKGQTQRKIIEDIVTKASVPSELGSISENLSTQQLTRGKVVFGMARDFLRQLAKFQQATFYVEDGKVNFVRADDLPTGEVVELNPASGLIGVPVQSELGVQFKCLLNPRIKLGTMVHIDSSLVREAQFTPNFTQIGQTAKVQKVNPLEVNGLYKVISIDHIGDTRGDDWYTECKTVSQKGAVPDLLTLSTGNPFG